MGVGVSNKAPGERPDHLGEPLISALKWHGGEDRRMKTEDQPAHKLPVVSCQYFKLRKVIALSIFIVPLLYSELVIDILYLP